VSNLGVNITALSVRTSLGVGGIAVALAVQSIWAILLHHCQFAVDKPFEVGDACCQQRVWHGGTRGAQKPPRIRRPRGASKSSMSNTDLLKNTTANTSALNERRAVFTFGVTLQHRAERCSDSRLDSPLIESTPAAF